MYIMKLVLSELDLNELHYSQVILLTLVAISFT